MTEIYFIEDKNETYNTERLSVMAYEFVKQKTFEKTGVICDIKKSESGKPFLKDINNLYFNISHTKNALAVIFSSSPVGIDIEFLREVNLSATKKFCSKAETEYIGQNTQRFFEIWTKKEAYIKEKGLKLKDIKTAIAEISTTLNIKGYVISFCGEDVKDYSFFETDCDTLAKNLENLS